MNKEQLFFLAVILLTIGMTIGFLVGDNKAKLVACEQGTLNRPVAFPPYKLLATKQGKNLILGDLK